MFSGDSVKSVATQFNVDGELRASTPFSHGHINDSFLLTYDCRGQTRRFLLQRINQAVFPQPAQVMDNIRRVTQHLRAKLSASGAPEPGRRALTLVPAHTGHVFHQEPDGHCWRMFHFVENVHVYEAVRTPVQAEAAGRSFGLFQRLLEDLPPPRLYETIPHFHDTPRRFAALEQAVLADVCGRAAEARAEIDSLLGYRPLGGTLVDHRQKNELPERIVHNDAKISNVLFDDHTGEAVCVTDLDTVMPGTALYDFGDMVRSMSTTAPEDEPDASRATVDMTLFAGIARGYLSSTGSFLTAAEKEHLALAGQVITLEQGVRFLTDYLQGDKYYRIAHPRHNLQRCRTQLHLLECLIQREGELRRIIATAL